MSTERQEAGTPSSGTVDVTAAALNQLLCVLSPEDLETVATYLETVFVPADEVVLRQGECGREMYFIGQGEALVHRDEVELARLRAGDHFGEIGLITGQPRSATVVAVTPLTLCRLTRARYEALGAERPSLALHVVQALIATMRRLLTEMTDSVGLLLKERSLPRRAEVDVRLEGELRRVRAGMTLGALLPAEVRGHRVVAALVDRKAVSLNSVLSYDADVLPLTTEHWEGRRMFRLSVGLLLLEAAWRFDPGLKLKLGRAVGAAQIVQVDDGSDRDRAELAVQLTLAMRALSATGPAVRVERWTVGEASDQLLEQGWTDAARLLRVARSATVPLVTCGGLYALSPGPLLPSLGGMDRVELVPHPEGFLLFYGDEERRDAVKAFGASRVFGQGGSRPKDDGAMVREHESWLRLLGVTSVGAFNELCISGQVTQIIRVSEGFHEKRIGQIADAIRACAGRVRVISVAGPSSSGKTTFIKRLKVQLQINGIHPLEISLDDYYVDREKTVRDAAGNYDFESIEALDLALLQDHLGRLLRGEAVRTARYDFILGKGFPDGGPTFAMGETDVLLLEGIHGLNPRLLGSLLEAGQVFRIFIHPTTGLRFDNLSRMRVSDVRLLRRIVRDRHHRGTSAADNIMRWPLVRAGERTHIFPFQAEADAVFDSSLIYEPSVLKVYADCYLLEVPRDHPAVTTAHRLRQLIDRFITIYPDHVPPTSLLREFIGGSGFQY